MSGWSALGVRIGSSGKWAHICCSSAAHVCYSTYVVQFLLFTATEARYSYGGAGTVKSAWLTASMDSGYVNVLEADDTGAADGTPACTGGDPPSSILLIAICY